MSDVLDIQRNLMRSYEDDMVKYARNSDKSKIKECFKSIPNQLSKENKKFRYSVVKKGSRASAYEGSLQWIEDAGIIRRCYNLSITEFPLDGNAEKDMIKVYMQDTGLEVDFVIRYRSKCTLIEVKAASGNTKSTRTILKHPEKYHVYEAIKLGDYNVGRSDMILTLPLYMAFLLNEY